MTVQPSGLFSVLEITGPLRAGASNDFLGAEKIAIFRSHKNTLLSLIIDLGGPCYSLKGEYKLVFPLMDIKASQYL